MKVAIYGAGNAGKFLYDDICRCSNIKVEAFVDNIIEGEYGGIKIWKPEHYFGKSKDSIDAVFLAAGAQKTVKLMIDSCISYGIYDIYMMHDIAGKSRLSVFDEKGEINERYLRKIHFSKEKPTLPYYEVPITDKCNLNCKGCLFACNAFTRNEHIPCAQIIRDARRMRDLFWDIPWIRILGGEPLLHPDIEEILKEYRVVFSNSEIDLCTNGLLLPKMPSSFFEVLRQNEITVHVSGYKPTYYLLSQISEILSENHLNFTLLKREKFAKYYTLKNDGDAGINFQECMASGCREVYNGRLLRCSAVIAFEKFNENYHTEYHIKKGKDWLDIYDKSIDAWKMKAILDNASQICQYCNPQKAKWFDWSYAGSDAGIKDYII